MYCGFRLILLTNISTTKRNMYVYIIYIYIYIYIYIERMMSLTIYFKIIEIEDGFFFPHNYHIS